MQHKLARMARYKIGLQSVLCAPPRPTASISKHPGRHQFRSNRIPQQPLPTRGVDCRTERRARIQASNVTAVEKGCCIYPVAIQSWRGLSE